MHCSKLGMWKGYHLSVEAVSEGSTFTAKKGNRLDLGAEPPPTMTKGLYEKLYSLTKLKVEKITSLGW